MAEHLQSLYRDLEAKVAEKTLELEEKRERLQALYDVTALVASATTLEELARRLRAPRRGAWRKADAVALRWSDEANRRYLLLAAEGLPQDDGGRGAVPAGRRVRLRRAAGAAGVRVIPIQPLPPAQPAALQPTPASRRVVAVPVRLHERTMGEVEPVLPRADRAVATPSARCSRRSTAHLAGAMENLRLNALEKEAAVVAGAQRCSRASCTTRSRSRSPS